MLANFLLLLDNGTTWYLVLGLLVVMFRCTDLVMVRVEVVLPNELGVNRHPTASGSFFIAVGGRGCFCSVFIPCLGCVLEFVVSVVVCCLLL